MGDQAEISVEVSNNGAASGYEVQIWANPEAIDFLIRQLQGLRQAGDHMHLMSPNWGGHNLVINTREPGSQPVHHLKLTRL